MKATCSIAKGRGSVNHNLRIFQPKNADPALKDKNLIIKNEPIDEKYEELFADATKKYNEKVKEKHPERIIKSYLEKIERSKQEKSFYEIIAEIGNTADIKKGSAEENLCREALKDYAAGFEKRNKNFAVFCAVMHEDEESLCHLHIDFVPVSYNSKRGMETKNSMTGALREMGFTGKDGFAQWRDREQVALIACMRKYGLEYKQGSGREEHLSIPEYKKAAAAVQKKREELEELQKKSEAISAENEKLVAENESLKFENEAEKKRLDEAKKIAIEAEKKSPDRVIPAKKNLVGKEIRPEMVVIPSQDYYSMRLSEWHYKAQERKIAEMKRRVNDAESRARHMEQNAAYADHLAGETNRLRIRNDALYRALDAVYSLPWPDRVKNAVLLAIGKVSPDIAADIDSKRAENLHITTEQAETKAERRQSHDWGMHM